MIVVPRFEPDPNAMETMLPITEPSLQVEYRWLRGEWLAQVWSLLHHVRVHVMYGPSNLGQNIVVVYAHRIMELETAMAAVRSADMRLRAKDA